MRLLFSAAPALRQRSVCATRRRLISVATTERLGRQSQNRWGTGSVLALSAVAASVAYAYGHAKSGPQHVVQRGPAVRPEQPTYASDAELDEVRLSRVNSFTCQS